MTILVLVFALLKGSVAIPWTSFWQQIGSKGQMIQNSQDQVYNRILWSIRLPRVLVAFLIGASLSLSGMTMQSLLKNPLADGSTLGVAAGASLGASLAIAFSWQIAWSSRSAIFLSAIVFSFLALLLILSFALYLDRQLNNLTVILSGIVFSMLVSAILNLLLVFAQEKLHSLVFWTMGSLSGTTYQDAWLLTLVLVLIAAYIYSQSQALNAFAMGDQVAHNIGLNRVSMRLKLFLLVSILVGLSVAIAGVIPFVGLIIPHVSRKLIGSNHRHLTWMTLILGGNFLVLTDLMARTLAAPLEIPLGAISSLIGTLVFVWVFVRRRRA